MRRALEDAVTALDIAAGVAIQEAIAHRPGRRRLRQLDADLRRAGELGDRLRSAIAALPPPPVKSAKGRGRTGARPAPPQSCDLP